MESYSFLISGKVQHVYYRKFVSQALMRLQTQGYIHNLTNGQVEVVVRLYEDDIAKVEDILRSGSPASNVESIDMEIIDEDDIIYDGFEIRY